MASGVQPAGRSAREVFRGAYLVMESARRSLLFQRFDLLPQIDPSGFGLKLRYNLRLDR